MDPIIIAAFITGGLGLIASIIFNIKYKKDSKKKIEKRIEDEKNFLESYFRVFAPNSNMSIRHIDILEEHFDEISNALHNIVETYDWETLIQLKSRIREYFEFSGRYKEGITFGKQYYVVFSKKRKIEEAIWAKFKDIGYLEILSENYQQGIIEINQAIEMLTLSNNIKKEIKNECYFYCYRYKGIAFLRNNGNGNLSKSKEMFNKANSYAEYFNKNSIKWLELKARIMGNYGNLEIKKETTESVQKALEYYKSSYKLFNQLKDKGHFDYEHLAIASLKIAEAYILLSPESEEIEDFLEKALNGAVQIGWQEGESRVNEQYARLYLRRSYFVKVQQKINLLTEAQKYATRSINIYRSLNLQKAIGRLEEIKKMIKEQRNFA